MLTGEFVNQIKRRVWVLCGVFALTLSACQPATPEPSATALSGERPDAESVLLFAKAMDKHPSVDRARVVDVLDRWLAGTLQSDQASAFIAELGGTDTAQALRVGCDDGSAQAACAACLAQCAILQMPSGCACAGVCAICGYSEAELGAVTPPSDPE